MQIQAFKDKFGREPEDDDLVFFDPNADKPKPVSEEAIMSDLYEAAMRVDIDPYRALRGFNCTHEEAINYIKTRRFLEECGGFEA